MKPLLKLACAAAVAILPACGDDTGPDGLTGEQRDRLNALAESQDLNNADLVDTSPDSLVPGNEALSDETDEAAAAGAAPEGNAAAVNGK